MRNVETVRISPEATKNDKPKSEKQHLRAIIDAMPPMSVIGIGEHYEVKRKLSPSKEKTIFRNGK